MQAPNERHDWRGSKRIVQFATAQHLTGFAGYHTPNVVCEPLGRSLGEELNRRFRGKVFSTRMQPRTDLIGAAKNTEQRRPRKFQLAEASLSRSGIWSLRYSRLGDTQGAGEN